VVFPSSTPLMSDVLCISAIVSLLASLFTIGCCFYLNLHKKSSKRYIIYTLISDSILSLSYMGRFADWHSIPKQGFWCQWSGFLLVVGANSLTLWISATATYLLFLFLRGKPGIKFELFFLILWPLVTIIPAAVPYAIYATNQVYIPVSTAQCLSQPDMFVYLVLFWVGLLLLYIIISYTVIVIYIYYIYVPLRDSINDNYRMHQIVTLAVSPIIYLFLYIWIIIARFVQLATGGSPLILIRFAVATTVWIGFLNSVWFGYSRNIYKRVYEKIFGEKALSTKGIGDKPKTGVGSVPGSA